MPNTFDVDRLLISSNAGQLLGALPKGTIYSPPSVSQSVSKSASQGLLRPF